MAPAGQRTMSRLARLLDVPVFGTRKPLGSGHYDARGFDPRFERLLVEASPRSIARTSSPSG